jgi:hypothetical protein
LLSLQSASSSSRSRGLKLCKHELLPSVLSPLRQSRWVRTCDGHLLCTPVIMQCSSTSKACRVDAAGRAIGAALKRGIAVDLRCSQLAQASAAALMHVPCTSSGPVRPSATTSMSATDAPSGAVHPRVLSIQSHVVHGYVGNRVGVFEA